MRSGLRLSLFWRTFLLIWLAMAMAVVISNMTTRELINRERLGLERKEELADVAVEAVALQRQAGRGAARRFLREMGEAMDLHLVLLAPGRAEQLPRQIGERLRTGWHAPQPAVVEVGGGFRLVAWPRVGGSGWLDPTTVRGIELAIAVVLVTLVCWWIARRISRPLRDMETTARAIAAGETGLRLGGGLTGRRDELGALAGAFNAMTSQLCNLLDRQKELLRDISHDLRTPLMRQRVAIELAVDAGGDKELMQSILRQNEQIESMTEQVLTLHRLAGNNAQLQVAPVELGMVVKGAVDDAAGYAGERGVELRLDLPPVELAIRGDASLIRRALDNVLQNALDHTTRGGTVTVCLTKSCEGVVCEITDGGPGVAEDSLERLFEPFYQLDSARAGKGWGLGLAIARHIMDVHGGRISARNGETGGLVVRLCWKQQAEMREI